jgi:MFS superfamily sulfate permease-like transporter
MFAAKHGGRFDANQENLTIAASNLFAGLGGGFPVSRGTSQSLVNEEGGAKTPLSTALAAVLSRAIVRRHTCTRHANAMAATRTLM